VKNGVLMIIHIYAKVSNTHYFKYITIDGVEGAGKSTQIDFICQYLTDKDINIVLTREPGGSAIGEKIRTLLLSNSNQFACFFLRLLRRQW
jgi:thymidylate kinase